MTKSPEIFYEGLKFGEGPRWHDGRLWLSDFFGPNVLSLGPTGDKRVEVELDDWPSGLGWLPNGELLIVAMTSRQIRRVDAAGNVHVHADLSVLTEWHCNDMVVDGFGNAYVGNFGFDTEAKDRKPTPANLLMARPDGSVLEVATNLKVPNGSVITPDGKTLIVGESMGRNYTAFSINDDATLSEGRLWADLGEIGPDGCALDADGAIWVADAYGGGCHRVAEGGDVLESITASQPVFACALGGADRRTLYLVTCPGYPDEERAALGRIEVVEVDVPGVGWP